MQDHVWDPSIKYDCIWLHWFLMYLTDDDLVQSLQKCVDHLSVDKLTGNSGLQNLSSVPKGVWQSRLNLKLIMIPCSDVPGLQKI